MRVRREGEIAAERAALGDPEPVGEDHVDGTALERHRGAVLAGKLGRLERKAMLAIEAVTPDDVELPVDRAEFQNADPYDGQRFGHRRHGREPAQGQQQPRP